MLAALIVILAGYFGATAERAEAAGPQLIERCVTPQEYWQTPKGLTRMELEALWEVRGLGRWSNDPQFGHILRYPRCDLTFPKRGWIGIQYDNQNRSRFYIRVHNITI